MSTNNNIQTVYCSESLKKTLKDKGCNLKADGTNIPKSAYELSVALDWVFINFGYHVWATYDDVLKLWVGNYHKIGDRQSWVSGFASKTEATEAALEIVVDYLI